MRRRYDKWVAMILIASFFVAGISTQGVQAAKAKVRLSKTKINIFAEKTAQLKVKGTKKRVRWKSSRPKVAKVNQKGVVRGIQKGTAKIYARVGQKKFICHVTVKRKTVHNTEKSPSLSLPASYLPTRSSLPAGKSSVPNASDLPARESFTPEVSPVVRPSADISSEAPANPSITPENTPTASPTQEPSPQASKGPIQYGAIPDPVFSQESGVYDKPFSLLLSAKEGTTIYYTTDGSIPDPDRATKETVPSLSVEASKANVALLDGASVQDVSDGVKIMFEQAERSASFRLPEHILNYTGYGTIRIDCTTAASNSSGGGWGGWGDDWFGRNEQSLKIAGIVSGATHPYQEPDGTFTRKFELTQNLTANQRQTVTFDISSQAKDGIGFLMLGSNSSSIKEITIHSITLLPLDPSEYVFQTKPITYKQPISVKNRNGEANVLSSTKNVSLMYNGVEAQAYYPSASQVAKATTIRALAIDQKGNRSNIVTNTYFVGNDIYKKYPGASVMSVVMNPDDLLSPDKGIYRVGNYQNKGKEWEREADVIYFDEDGTVPFETKMGVRIHGGYTRHWGQKSLNFYFRDEYGLKNLKGYDLIPGAMNFEKTEKTLKYKNFMLRNGGNEAEYTKLRDVFIQGLVGDRQFTTQASRLCVLFLNGEYWGIYNLTEKYGDSYLEEKFGVNKDNVVVMKCSKEGVMELDEGQTGDEDFYNKELLTLVQKDMSDPTVYKEFCKAVDIQSFIDYFVVETYIGNRDWPDNNLQMWRVRTPDGSKYGDGKWRMMLYDTEFSMNLWNCDSEIGNPFSWTSERNVLFAAVMKNAEFRKDFIRTYMDIYNVNFEYTMAKQKLNAMAELYFPLMNQYYVRFGLLGNNSYTTEADARNRFNSHITDVDNYMSGRRSNILQYLQSSFSLQAPAKVTMKGLEGSQIRINTSNVELKSGSWSGTYYKETPVTVTAPDVEGYTFTGWSVTGGAAAASKEKMTEVTLSESNVNIEANYEKNAQSDIKSFVK